jgi:hypothetical protein
MRTDRSETLDMNPYVACADQFLEEWNWTARSWHPFRQRSMDARVLVDFLDKTAPEQQ